MCCTDFRKMFQCNKNPDKAFFVCDPHIWGNQYFKFKLNQYFRTLKWKILVSFSLFALDTKGNKYNT